MIASLLKKILKIRRVSTDKIIYWFSCLFRNWILFQLDLAAKFSIVELQIFVRFPAILTEAFAYVSQDPLNQMLSSSSLISRIKDRPLKKLIKSFCVVLWTLRFLIQYVLRLRLITLFIQFRAVCNVIL